MDWKKRYQVAVSGRILQCSGSTRNYESIAFSNTQKQSRRRLQRIRANCKSRIDDASKMQDKVRR